MSSIYEDQIYSKTKSYAIINYSYNDLSNLIENKNIEDNIWEELDINTWCMIQKLFLVETAITNSQSLFSGNVNMNFMPLYSNETIHNSNYINIGEKSSTTDLFKEGDAIHIYDVRDGNYYRNFEKYSYSDKDNRKIIKIEQQEKEIILYFSGLPIDIEKGITAVSHLPNISGLTDNINYHTGSYSSVLGGSSFKYRNIENIWGNGCVILDGIYILQNNIFYRNMNDIYEILNYKLPFQNLEPNKKPGNSAIISSLFFDKDNTLLILPNDIGDSTVTGIFGDGYFYYDNSSNKKKYFTVGMTLDLKHYAGLFSYRIIPIENLKMVENTSRIIMRK